MCEHAQFHNWVFAVLQTDHRLLQQRTRIVEGAGMKRNSKKNKTAQQAASEWFEDNCDAADSAGKD